MLDMGTDLDWGVIDRLILALLGERFKESE